MKRYYWTLVLLASLSVFVFGANAEINDGLVAFYPFNGNANDESGNGYDGTVFGAALTADRNGSPNSAYFFDGVDDYIEINDPVITSAPFSISFWISVEEIYEADNSNFIVSNTNDEFVGVYICHLRKNYPSYPNLSGEVLRYYIEVPSPGLTDYTRGYVSIGAPLKWHHFVVLWNGGG